MKKLVLLTLFFVSLNLVSKNECSAQTKLKPENCAYFQGVNSNNKNDVSEFIWVGWDRAGKHLKWVELDNEGNATAYIETSRDEWSIYMESIDGKLKFQIDLFKQQILSDDKEIATIKNSKDSYEYNKLGGSYIH